MWNKRVSIAFGKVSDLHEGKLQVPVINNPSRLNYTVYCFPFYYLRGILRSLIGEWCGFHSTFCFDGLHFCYVDSL